MIIGCEDFPKSEQGKLLIEDIARFINDQYHYSGQKVIEAFEMASTYQLYLDGKRVDPSTFGKHLSRASVGKILTAYKEIKQREKVTTNYALPEFQKEPITPDESWELVLKWFREEGKPTLVAPYLGAYDYLLSQGKIKKVKQVTKRTFESNLETSPERLAVEKYLKNLHK